MFQGEVDLEKLHRKLKAEKEYYSVRFYMDSHSFTSEIYKDGTIRQIMSTNELLAFIESAYGFKEELRKNGSGYPTESAEIEDKTVNKDMTMKEIDDLRNELKDSLTQTIIEFEKRTGLTVDSIDLERPFSPLYSSQNRSSLLNINLEIKL